MGAKTMGAVMVMMSISGGLNGALAQRPHATIDAAVGIREPYAVHCSRGRAHPSRARARCAVPRRRVTARYGYGAVGPWAVVGWGSARLWTLPSSTGSLTPGRLKDTIGRDDYRRLRRHARDLGLRGALTGTWAIPRYGPGILEVWADGVPVARMSDRDRDGWTDLTRLRRYW
jgi:hypothetical protein